MPSLAWWCGNRRCEGAKYNGVWRVGEDWFGGGMLSGGLVVWWAVTRLLDTRHLSGVIVGIQADVVGG